MNFSQKQAAILGAGAVLVLGFLILVFFNIKGGGEGKLADVQLKVWGVDSEKAFEGIIAGYSAFRPNVKVEYVQIDKDEYDSALLDALAAGEGPDIFMLDNNSIFRQMNKIVPVGPTQFNILKLRSLFPQVVEQDFVSDGKIYALPLYIDTLALAYNQDLFDQGSVVYPPGTWQDFQKTVQVLRKITPSGQILRAGAAIGGSDKSISNAQDILYLLMLQNGVPMVNEKLTAADFGARGKLGPQALRYYTQFANVASPYYTWNDSQPEFLESFAREETAMIFAYGDELNSLRDKNPFLNFRVTFVPQPAGAAKAVSYANYHGLAVSKQSRVSGWAWDFAIYAATRPKVIDTYLSQTGRPPALKSLINEKVNDEELGVYVRQALTARSWPQADDFQIKEIFSQTITNVLIGKMDAEKAIEQAQRLVSQLMK